MRNALGRSLLKWMLRAIDYRIAKINSFIFATIITGRKISAFLKPLLPFEWFIIARLDIKSRISNDSCCRYSICSFISQIPHTSKPQHWESTTPFFLLFTKMILWVFIALLYYHLLLPQALYYLFSSANKLCSGQNHQMERCNFMSFAVAERLNVQAEGCKFSWHVFLPLVLASYWTAERNIDLREKSYCSPPLSLFVKPGETRAG